MLLTFAAISSWDKFSEAQVSVIEEAAAANAIYQLTNGPEQDQLAVRGALGKYLKLAIDKDWPAMEVEQESEEVSGALGELYIDVIRFIQKGAMVPAQKKVTVSPQKGATIPARNGAIAQALTIELIKQLDTITKSRRTRVHLSAGIVPNMMWDVWLLRARAEKSRERSIHVPAQNGPGSIRGFPELVRESFGVRVVARVCQSATELGCPA